MPGFNFSPFPTNYYGSVNPEDSRDLMGIFSGQLNSMLGNVGNMTEQYRNAPKFDAGGIKRGIDESYFRSVALSPSVQSNLKGMGVGAAEGTAALQAGLPLMQARAESYGNLERDKYQADQAYLMNLFNMLSQGNQLGLAGQNQIMQLYQGHQNYDINK